MPAALRPLSSVARTVRYQKNRPVDTITVPESSRKRHRFRVPVSPSGNRSSAHPTTVIAAM